MRQLWHRAVRVCILVILALTAVVLRPGPRVEAYAFVVDNLSDNPSLTACTPAANDCSLRGGLSVANANGAVDTITFVSGLTGTIAIAATLPVSGAFATTIAAPGGGSTAPGIAIDCGGGAYPGFTVTSAGNTIRHLSIVNCFDGILITGEPADTNLVAGNWIGLNPSGVAVGNVINGVHIDNGADGNIIGGSFAADRNVISGNVADGIAIANAASDNNIVRGNYIGTDAAGMVAKPNALHGIAILAGTGTIVGGTTSGERNVISGNGGSGVVIQGTGNTVKGNYIGTNAAGDGAIPNGRGVYANSNNTIIGAPGEGNVIAYNTGDGVQIDWGTGNAIRTNSIHSNAAEGIHNTNGGNLGLAPPVIDSVGVGSASGHSVPKCYPCTVDVFSDSDGQGRIYHGSTTTNDDAAATWTYTGPLTGPNITATITDAGGNTSEFSAPVPHSAPVGGIAELPDIVGTSAEEAATPAEGAGWSSHYAALAGGLAAAVVALTAGAWYARRRWVR